MAAFRVLNYISHFEALDISNEVLFMSNIDGITKLRPGEFLIPIYPIGAHSFGASSPRVRFLDVYGFPFFLNIVHVSHR